MPISEEIGRIIMTGGNAMDIAEQAAREGVKDLRQSGLLKVRQGVTTELVGIDGNSHAPFKTQEDLATTND